MVEIYTSLFLLTLGVFFFVWAFKNQNLYAGLGSAFIFVVFGILFLSTGIGFPTGDTSAVSYTYTNSTVNQTTYDSSGAISGYSAFNTPVTLSKAQTTTYNFNTTRDQFTDGLGLLIIFTGLFIGFFTVNALYVSKQEPEFRESEYDEL